MNNLSPGTPNQAGIDEQQLDLIREQASRQRLTVLAERPEPLLVARARKRPRGEPHQHRKRQEREDEPLGASLLHGCNVRRR